VLPKSCYLPSSEIVVVEYYINIADRILVVIEADEEARLYVDD
jgi:hypothetical protein